MRNMQKKKKKHENEAIKIKIREIAKINPHKVARK